MTWLANGMSKRICAKRGAVALHRNIGSQYYYRLMQSPTKDKVTEEMHQVTAPMQDKLEFIKNPVVAEFLGLAQNSDFTESDLEGNIISHLQKFIMELGVYCHRKLNSIATEM